MSWNYRVVKSKTGLDIREIYYTNTGKIFAYSEAIEPYGETLKELRTELKWMRRALSKPVIDEAKLPKGKRGRKK